MIQSVDVTEHNDTELGALVRDLHARGCEMVRLFDGSTADERAMVWHDGWCGLYRFRCGRDHVWLSALYPNNREPMQGVCPTCGEPGARHA